LSRTCIYCQLVDRHALAQILSATQVSPFPYEQLYATFESIADVYTLLLAQAPWALAVVEAILMSLSYFVMVPDALLVRKPWFALHYSFKHSVEDVLLFSLARDLAVILAYACGAGANYHRWAISLR